MKLWLDDERDMPDGYHVHVRDEERAEILLSLVPSITHVSLDCDLGDGNGSGYGVAYWITAQWSVGKLLMLDVTCHSANPVERAAVVLLLKRAKERLT